MNSRQIGFFTALALAAGARAHCERSTSPWGISVYGGDAMTEAGSLRSPHTFGAAGSRHARSRL